MFKALLFVLLLAGLISPPVRQTLAEASDDLSELRKEVEALKQGQLQLQRELQEINALLRRRQPSARPSATDVQNVVLPIDGFPSKGSQSAKLVLIEFTDYQCPFCSRYVRQTLPQIERDYINTGQVRYVVRDFPLESIHKDALKAAEAAHCAGEQGKYWQMHDQLFASQNALGRDDLSAHAGTLGLDVQGFQRCLDSDKYAMKIRQDLAEAQKMSIRATPSFLLGVAKPDGSGVTVVKMIAGAHPYAIFKEAIDSLLSVEKPVAPKQ